MTLVKFGIVNDRGTDGYSLVRVYSDGTQGGAQGHYRSVEQAEQAAAELIADLELGDVTVEDWTTDDDE